MKRYLTGVALSAALLTSGCAELDASLTPDNLHLGVAALSNGYRKGVCGSFGQTDFCSKDSKHIAKKAAGWLNFAIDLWPFSQDEQPKE